MKRKLLFLLFAVLFAVPSFAQKKDKEEKKKEMLEFKIEFLAKEMELRDDQKKQFKEIYTQMESERRAIFKKIKQAEKSIKGNKNATEADYDRASKEIAAARNQMTQIENKYEAKFASFLSKKQIFKMKEAETKFMETMRNCRDKKRSEQKK